MSDHEGATDLRRLLSLRARKRVIKPPGATVESNLQGRLADTKLVLPQAGAGQLFILSTFSIFDCVSVLLTQTLFVPLSRRAQSRIGSRRIERHETSERTIE